MDTLYFGIAISSNDKFDAQDVAARLFVCPRISPQQVSIMLDRLIGGEMSEEEFISKTDTYILSLFYQSEQGQDYKLLMRNKYAQWCDLFAEPTADDFKYLEKNFGLTIKELYGVDEEQPIRPLRSARQLAAHIKQRIKGQDAVINKLSVAFFQHLDSKRKQYTSRIKSPALVMGSTGTGKSEMLRLFGKACDCPVIRINLSSVAPEGWRGFHITDIFAHEIRAGVSIDELKYAIVVFHEFDKITHYGNRIVSSAGNDIDMDMMRDIMRLFETDYSLHIDTGIDQSSMKPATYKLPVDNMMFVFDGAFHGIENIIRKRLNINRSIGYSTTAKQNLYKGVNLQTLVSNDDLMQWGYLPELIGRIGQIAVMNPLTSEVIYEIMTTAKGSVLDYHIDYCSRNNIDLRFEEEALRLIADTAYESGLGFRNVKTLLSRVMFQIYYDFPESGIDQEVKVVKINKDYILKTIELKHN